MRIRRWRCPRGGSTHKVLPQRGFIKPRPTAVQFTASDQYVQVPSAAGIHNAAQTVEAWVRVDSLAATNLVWAVAKNGGASGNEWGYVTTDGAVGVKINNGTSTIQSATGVI